MTFHLNSSQLGETRVSFTAGWSFPADELNKACLFSSAIEAQYHPVQCVHGGGGG